MEKKKEFYTKKRYRENPWNILITVLLVFQIVSGFFDKSKNHSYVYYIVFGAFVLALLVLIVFQLHALMVRKNKRIPDIKVTDEEIIVPEGAYNQEKVMKITDIKTVEIPRYDKLIKLNFKDGKKYTINFYYYNQEDQMEIRKIFNEIKEKIEGVAEKEAEKEKSYIVVKGSLYKK